MPAVEVLYYREGSRVPVLEWLATLDLSSIAVCLDRLERLEAEGHELRRPGADYLRDGIYELRAKRRGINYRMLYFFQGRLAVVVSHGFVKQRARIPELEVELAVTRKARFSRDPVGHTHRRGT